MSTPIGFSWNEFKELTARYQIPIDYAPVGAHYFLFAGDGNLFVEAFITDPSDVSDFETNYKPFASEVSIPPSDASPATLVSQGTTPWVVSFPAGAATAALQSAGNTILSGISAKIPVQGQAPMAASVPVVIASNQTDLPITVSGPISLPIGAATSALQTSGNLSLSSIDSKLSAPILAAQSGLWSIGAVQSGAWSVTQSGPWVVSISGTVPISALSLPLPSGAATESTLAAINSKTPALGQALMAASSPVVIAADQSPFSVSIGTSSGKTIVGKTGTLVSVAVLADQVILTYTVTLGKTFYLEGFDWSVGKTGIDHADADYGLVSLETPLGAKLQTWFARGAGTASFSRSLPEPLPIPAGTVIRLVVTPSIATSLTWLGNLIGYEK